MRRRAIVCGAAFAWMLLTAGGCADAPPPNLVLITVDTLRPDFLGAYGFAGDSSPNLDAFAERSVVFERALAASSRTAPAHASLFTSRWVREHSIGYRNGSTQLADEPVLAELLAGSGYDTGAFVGNSMLRRRIGFDRGFAVYDDELPDSEKNRDVFERVASRTTARASEWLGRDREAPYFLWVQYNDPHGPYTPPADYVDPSDGRRASFDVELPVLEIQRGIGGIPAYQAFEEERHLSQYRARYAGEVRYFDAALGALLDAVAAASRGRPTVTVITADHGESFGEAGIYLSHGYATTPELVQIPLLIAAPGSPPGRVRVPVHQVDLMPTLLDLAGIEAPAGLAGVSLAPLLDRRGEIAERTLFADVGAEVGAYRGDRYLRMRLEGDLAGASAGTPIAFERVADGSWQPIPPDPAWVGELLAYAADRAPMRAAPPLDDDDRARLRALGYLR